jgi:hypothetical protein
LETDHSLPPREIGESGAFGPLRLMIDGKEKKKTAGKGAVG